MTFEEIMGYAGRGVGIVRDARLAVEQPAITPKPVETLPPTGATPEGGEAMVPADKKRALMAAAALGILVLVVIVVGLLIGRK